MHVYASDLHRVIQVAAERCWVVLPSTWSGLFPVVLPQRQPSATSLPPDCIPSPSPATPSRGSESLVLGGAASIPHGNVSEMQSPGGDPDLLTESQLLRVGDRPSVCNQLCRPFWARESWRPLVVAKWVSYTHSLKHRPRPPGEPLPSTAPHWASPPSGRRLTSTGFKAAALNLVLDLDGPTTTCL